MHRFCYNGPSITSIPELGKVLAVPLDLTRIAEESNKYYVPNKPQLKSDGGTRLTYRVLEPLEKSTLQY
jgi:hypothetical protein